VRIAYAGDISRGVEQMQVALTSWVERLPGAPASVRRDGPGPVFESCDPGPNAASVARAGSKQAVKLARSRTYRSVEMTKSASRTTPTARCGADRLVRAFTIAELNDPTVDPQRIGRVLAPCMT
jgi:hypothetical protein